MPDLVLVTGGSGFLASHCILQLLASGYAVRTTVRSEDKKSKVLSQLETAGLDSPENVTFAIADLTFDKGWPAAVAGCTYVLHTASPFPDGPPDTEDDLIIPARDGSLRVLRAAHEAGVKRVVLTSSFAAIGYTPKAEGEPFTEEDWTNPDTPGLSAYVKSKTIAECAAWNFIATEGGALELSVINPVGIFGPILGPDYSTSIGVVKRLMDGLPVAPRLSFGVVDVRDAADLHLRAMTNPAAKGERFLAVAGKSVTMHEIAEILLERMGDSASRVPTRVLPNWLVRLDALFDSSLKPIVSELGQMKQMSNEKSRRLLGWSPRPNEEALVATAQSLIDLGLVNNS